MKKALSLMLVFVLAFGLAACDSESSAVARYVEKNGDAIIKVIEDSFMGSSGMTCHSTVKAVGNGIVLDINVNELAGVDPAIHDQLRERMAAISNRFDGKIDLMQVELPELAYLSININEKDGTNLFTITID